MDIDLRNYTSAFPRQVYFPQIWLRWCHVAHLIKWFSFQRDKNFILLHFIFWSSEQILRMPWQHRSRVSYVICKNCSDWLVRIWISWSQHMLAPAKFESGQNECKEFKFWWLGKWVPGPDVFFAVCCNFLFNCTGIVGMRYLRRIYLYIRVCNNMTEICSVIRVGEALLA